jgi:hypothetical protein
MRLNCLIGLLFLAYCQVAISATLITHCDLPGPTLKSFPQADVESCRTSCDAAESCKAYAYISGWNRCFFKEGTPKQIKLRISAAAITAVENKRDIGNPMEDTDIPGKDLRKVSGITSAQDCGRKCIEEPKCVAYSFLDAYGICWLKDRLSAEQKKIFYCGVK